MDTPERTLGELVGASLREHFNPMVIAWHELPVPVVVAVNGIAAGAGMSLALVGDIVLAAHSATFVQLFAPKLGLMPDLGSSFYMPRLIGTARAKALAFLGEPLSASEAERWGLIWRCVDNEDLMPQAASLVRRLALGPTQAFKRIKQVFNEQPATRLADQLALEAALQAELADTKDFTEGVLAFRAKRAPTSRASEGTPNPEALTAAPADVASRHSNLGGTRRRLIGLGRAAAAAAAAAAHRHRATAARSRRGAGAPQGRRAPRACAGATTPARVKKGIAHACGQRDPDQQIVEQRAHDADKASADPIGDEGCDSRRAQTCSRP